MTTEAIAIGNDHDVQARLAELGAVLKEAGVEHFSAYEVCKIRYPDRIGQHAPCYAIPPLTTWSRMVRTLREVAEPLREVYGGPLRVLNGYRPASYNTLVTKSKQSRHIYFEALDLTCDDVARLRAIAADFYLRNVRLSLGFGFYAGNIHVDIGHRRRYWGSQAVRELHAARRRARR